MRVQGMSISVGASLLLFSVGSFAQTPVKIVCPTNSPVALSVESIQPGATTIQVKAKNVGDKPITAIVLKWKLLHSTSHSSSETNTVDYAMSGDLLAPQATESLPADMTQSKGVTLVSAELSCEAVLFPGNAMWGNALVPEVERIKNIRLGAQTERKRLLGLYKTEGITKLVQEMNRNVVE